MEKKTKEDIHLLKSYYIKRLTEILDEEFNEDQANFGIYTSDDYEFDPGYIIANKIGLEKVGIEFLKSSQTTMSNIENDSIEFHAINKWISGNVSFENIIITDKKTTSEMIVNESEATGFIVSIIPITVGLFILSSLIIGAIQIVGWIVDSIT